MALVDLEPGLSEAERAALRQRIAAQYGVNEVHLGIVFLAAMQLGYLTPPVGLNLFIASYRFNKPIMHVYSATFPFLVILMLSVIMITYWPTLSLWLL